MSSKKRVFSNNNKLNYNDYYKIKNGSEILKIVKSENNQAILKQFKNYQSWQTLSTAYFPFINNDECEIKSITNMYNSNESFVNQHKVDHHNSCCYECGYEKHKIHKNICKEERNILYPTGKIITKKEITPQFPSNIYLCNWCNNKTNNLCKLNHHHDHHHIETNISKNCDCKNKKKCNLCKNARKLFI